MIYSIFVQKHEEYTKEEIEELIKKKKEILAQLEQIGKDSNYMQELSELAILQMEIDHFEEAEKNLSTCLLHFRKQKDRLGVAATLGILGTLYYQQGEHEKSISAYQEALFIYKELLQTNEIITCLKLIGMNLTNLQKYEDANNIFLECSALCSEHGDIYGLLDCLGNLITIHEVQENWDVVYELYKKSLEAFEQISDKKGVIVSLLNLGLLNKNAEKLNEALFQIKKALEVASQSNYGEYILKARSLIGEIFFYMGEFNAAKDQFISALKYAKEVQAKNAIIQLKILLNSLGLREQDIRYELEKNSDN